jgi:SAM-dependent methyltransferase
MGTRAQQVQWITGDVTRFKPEQPFDLWHDRAVFHFLTDPADREKYVATLHRSIKPGGHLVIGTFSLEGPPKCSGLDVQRYSPESLSETLGEQFELKESTTDDHTTPAGKKQHYIFCRFIRIP